MVGRTLGHYEIIEPLGAGGMGEVYRAHDTVLNRDVAIKVLHEDLSADVERLARLEREAQLLAALNHPNIEVIHGLEEMEAEDGATVRYLVLELIRGESLAERLSRGRIEVKKVLGIARQIAEALEAAHAKGIIHRDLKPGNVLLTPEGQAKVLDFGLAKSAETSTKPDGASAEISPEITDSPTVVAATGAGIILGTAAYMSPEQARGKPLDKRTDIWSFGCVLYEMLTGRRAFDGETVTDVLAAVVEREPDWDAVPGDAPVLVQLLLRQCLEKDPHARLHDVADARIEIVSATNEPDGGLPSVPLHVPRPFWRRALPWGTALLLAVVTVSTVYWSTNRQAQRLVGRFQITPAHGEQLSIGDDPNTAVSPDGSHIAYSTDRDGVLQLYVRAIDQAESVAIPGTIQAHSPFFSPDGRWVGFFDDSDRTLKKAPTMGGPAQLICEAPGAHAGASWGLNETIVFSSVRTGLGVVSSSGGSPEELTQANAMAGELRHEFPEILPDGEGVLFTIETDTGRAIAVLNLETRQHEVIIPAGTGAHYASTGHIVYGQGESLMAVPFDPTILEVTGPPFQLHEQVRTTADGSLEYSFSRDGMLLFASPAPAAELARIVWTDRLGTVTTTGDQQGSYDVARISPDENQVVIALNYELWIYDLRREVMSLLVSEGRSGTPSWSSDGVWVYYSSRMEDDEDIYRIPSDLSTPAELVLERERDQREHTISPGDSVLLFVEVDPLTGSDIWALSLAGDEEPEPIIRTSASETMPRFSPDGRRFAHVSDATGQQEVYVQEFPGPGRRWQVSSEGGISPVWSSDGREIFYRNGPQLMAVKMATSAGDEPGAPTLLFEDESLVLQDAARDGQFLMIERLSAPSSYLNVVLNWFEELERLVPRER